MTDADAQVRELTTDAEWDAAVPVLRQLWSDADESFVHSWREEDDYHLLGLFVGGADRSGDPGDDDADRGDDDADDADRGDDDASDAGRDEELVAVAGVSVQRVLHHARHAWVHDFVVREAARGEGHGADLLAAAEEWARDRDCEYVALAVHEGNDDVLGFYEAEGMDRWGHVVEREL